jgi:hypothetical protein
MCWSSDWEERELLKDEERREGDDRRTVEAAAERTASQPERESESEREPVRV